MRTILFRGKRKDNGEWIYGDLVGVDMICNNLIDVYDELGTYYGETPYVGFVDVVPETVGQFTGLTDKDGNKIYEGDIVREAWSPIFASKNNRLVEWVDASCGFEPFSDSKENCGHCGGGLTSCTVVIVGNIHDNPEMLEKNNE